MRKPLLYILAFSILILINNGSNRKDNTTGVYKALSSFSDPSMPDEATFDSTGSGYSEYKFSRFVNNIDEKKVYKGDVETEYYFPSYSIPAKIENIYLEDPLETGGGTDHPSGLNIRNSASTSLFQKYEVSTEKYFNIIFDNDIFSNTDYYYTNGVTLELWHPGLRILPTSYLLLNGGKNSVNHYSLSLTQTLYTPIDPDQTEVQVGDRPFASCLFLTHSNVSNNAFKKIRVTTGIDLGVIGPAALGGFVQKTIHNIKPEGWQNQISNDLILNYTIQLEKGIALSRNVEFIARLSGQAGTLYDNLGVGASIRISNASGYFESLFLSSRNPGEVHRLNYCLMFSTEEIFTGYNATLQGGLLENENDIYIIPAQDISRNVFHARLSIGLNYGRFGLTAEHIFLTREFNTGKNHMWSRIKTTFNL